MSYNPPNNQVFKSVKYFGSLNALRTISILLVIFYHTAMAEAHQLAVSNFGAKGVQLFFAISGFLISTLLLRECDKTGQISLRQFYMRRLLRIFPLYYAVLLIHVFFALTLVRHQLEAHQFLQLLPFYLTYTVNYAFLLIPHSSTILYGMAWSLASEEQFYSIWPWFERYFKWKTCTLIIASATVLLASLKFVDLHSVFNAWPYFSVVIKSCSLSICVGVLVAHLLHDEDSFEWLARIWTPYNSLIALVLLFALPFPRVPELMLAPICGFVVLSCVQSENHILTRLFQTRPMVSIGVLSYSMYLTHLLCNHAVKLVVKHLPVEGVARALTIFTLTSICTFVLATLTYKFFESYFLRKKRRYEVVSTEQAPSTEEPWEATPVAAG